MEPHAFPQITTAALNFVNFLILIFFCLQNADIWATGWHLGKWVRLKPVSCFIPNELVRISACCVQHCVVLSQWHQGFIIWTQSVCESEEHPEQQKEQRWWRDLGGAGRRWGTIHIFGMHIKINVFLWTFWIQSDPSSPNITINSMNSHWWWLPCLFISSPLLLLKLLQ